MLKPASVTGILLASEGGQELEVLMLVSTFPAMLCVNFQSLDVVMTVHAE